MMYVWPGGRGMSVCVVFLTVLVAMVVPSGVMIFICVLTLGSWRWMPWRVGTAMSGGSMDTGNSEVWMSGLYSTVRRSLPVAGGVVIVCEG